MSRTDNQEPKTVDKHLCAIQIFSPTQEWTQNTCNIFAILSFDTKQQNIEIEDKRRRIRYGFHEAEVHLETEGCTIAPRGRLVEIKHSINVKVSETREKKRSGFFGLGVNFEKMGLPASAGLKLSGAFSSKVVAEGEVEIQCAVVKPYGDYWKVYGVNDFRGVLDGNIIAEQPLCTINHDGKRVRVQAVVKVDLLKLWVEVDDGAVDPANANRNKIIEILVAKSIKMARHPQRFEEDVIIASHEISFIPKVDGDD